MDDTVHCIPLNMNTYRTNYLAIPDACSRDRRARDTDTETYIVRDGVVEFFPGLGIFVSSPSCTPYRGPCDRRRCGSDGRAKM